MLKSAESTRGWRRGMALGLGWAIVAAWLVYLLLQTGAPWDEAEHAHVAWLLSQGKRPLVDFFQHHQPLLWTLLSPYYRLGFEGAGVLLWGRVLVVCCALATVFSLRRLGHWTGVALWIFLTLLMPDLFVTRPETISTGLILVGLAIWAGPTTSTLSVVLAGAAAGAAVYASPRFLLLGGFFCVAGASDAHALGLSVRRRGRICRTLHPPRRLSARPGMVQYRVQCPPADHRW